MVLLVQSKFLTLSQQERQSRLGGGEASFASLSFFFTLSILLCLLVSVLGIQFRALGMAGQLCAYELLHILSSLSYF